MGTVPIWDIGHVYEKLNIHSKQELLDLVLFGSGVM